MRSRVIIVYMTVFSIGLISCQKNDSSNTPSLATTLSTSVAEIIGSQINAVTSANEQSVSVEKFDGSGQASVGQR